MPLKPLSHNELQGLYSKTFHPYSEVESNFDPDVHKEFEKLRTECKYYTLSNSDTDTHILCNNSLSILHINARSILTSEKFESFIAFLHFTGIFWDIVCISETWLDDETSKVRYLDGYDAFFENRTGKTGGGVAVYIRSNCVKSCNRLSLKSPADTETVFVQCILPSSVLIVGQVYRPPNACPSSFMEEMSDILDITTSSSSSIIIAGDFNFDLNDIDCDTNVSAFFNLMSSYGFLPSISLPTRQGDSRASILDNIFCNNIANATSSGVICNDLSDHFPVYLTLTMEKSTVSRQCRKITSFNYRRIKELRSHLQTELEDIFLVKDPDEACEKIIQAYSSGISRYSFTYTPSRKNTPIKPWITPGILASINRKNELFTLKSNSPSSFNVNEYRRYRNVLVGVLRESKKAFIQNELRDANPKKTWNILKELTESSPRNETMPKNFKTSNGLVEDVEEIARSFNAFFTSIGKDLKNSISQSSTSPLSYIPDFSGSALESLTDTNVEEIVKIVSDMRNVGGGFDKINTRIFKATYMSIAAAIVHFLNLCLQQSRFPTLLKRAVVKPIYKAGDKQQFSNYRPISLLPVISKLLEKLIYSRLNDHLDQNNILNENQFGFRKGLSTYMPLLLFHEKVTSALEANRVTCGLYLDLRKAFDTVDIDILLGKLHCYGIIGHAHDMVKSYLTNRTQCVQIDETRSGFLPLEIGVPQGSILGPLLFILYINDFPSAFDHVTTYVYADDTAIFVEGNSEVELQNIMDSLLPKIVEWFNVNQLSLNTDKTYYQIYTNKKVEKAITLRIAGANVLQAKTVKYLGVFIDEDLRWNTHINKLYTVLCRIVGLISRARHYVDSKHLLLLYNALFLPHVNYCCFIYSTTYSSHLQPIEKLQKRAIRLIDGQSRLAHTAPIFKKHKLLRLKDIGNQQILLLLLRKLNADLPPSIDQLFETTRPNRNSRHVKHFTEPFTSKMYKTRTVSWAGPRLWNKIMVPMFPMLETVPSSKISMKKLSKNYFVNQY